MALGQNERLTAEQRQLSPNEVIQLFNTIAQSEALLPIKVPPHYQKLIDEEVAAIGPYGPLYKTAYPTPERLFLRAPGEVADFVDDHMNMPPELSDVVIQKYQNRMLFFPTDLCAGHCQYCFRTALLSEEHADGQLPQITERLRKAGEYLTQHPEIEEVIFSGGDPLTLHPKLLAECLGYFSGIESVKNLRIHTRTIVFTPAVFREQMCELLGQYRVRVYFHITHPYEISPDVTASIKRLQKHGVRTYNQFPLLRGVNDHPQVLAEHVQQLDELGVRQVSMFIPDPINYSASFRIPLERLFGIIDTFNKSTSSWVNAGRVILDTPAGKVRREDIVSWDKQTGAIVFEREGKKVRYQDLPKEMDEPSSLERLLWKNSLAHK